MQMLMASAPERDSHSYMSLPYEAQSLYWTVWFGCVRNYARIQTGLALKLMLH